MLHKPIKRLRNVAIKNRAWLHPLCRKIYHADDNKRQIYKRYIFLYFTVITKILVYYFHYMIIANIEKFYSVLPIHYLGSLIFFICLKISVAYENHNQKKVLSVITS